ncbi:hypothetical protein F3I02_27470 [Bacillus sp. SRB3LM]|nr:hypothetical protein [Bacillus sp. SRB3LM]
MAGIVAILKKQMIIANINLLLGMYYFCSGRAVKLSEFAQSFFLFTISSPSVMSSLQNISNTPVPIKGIA